jgi:hypothetical protein
MLISDIYFTGKSYLKLPNCTAYHINHPARTAQGDMAIIIKNCINHYQLTSYSQDFLQATSGSAKDSFGILNISAVYIPPRHNSEIFIIP